MLIKLLALCVQGAQMKPGNRVFPSQGLQADWGDRREVTSM